MAHSHRHSFATFAVMGAIALAGIASTAYRVTMEPVMNAVSYVVRCLCDWTLQAVEKFKRHGDGFAKPQTGTVKARSFMARFMKRERPVQFSSWKMCPSV